MRAETCQSSPAYIWQKLGLLIQPRADVPWMVTHTGAATAIERAGTSLFDIYLTGRDSQNRSRIGRIAIDMRTPNQVQEIGDEPVLTLGELGAFDENGTSYPFITRHEGETRMYYTGWMPSVLTPFQNHLGLAVQQSDGTFQRYSRAPIMDRTDDDPFSIGAVCVLREDSLWRMWYTAFDRWGVAPGDPKHTYFIKYAESDDGVHWRRDNHIAINIEKPGEHSISRPAIIHHDGAYHMWYCVRGKRYRIGYAISDDGVEWTRLDDQAGISCSDSGWDAMEICYPHVFSYQSEWYMLYCGNDYGKAGLGIAKLRRADS